MIKVLLILIYFFLSQLTVNAQTRTYNVDWKKDIAITGIGLSLNLVGYTLSSQVDNPNEFEIKSLNKNNVWVFDRCAISKNSMKAQDLSDILLYSSTALPFLTYFDKSFRNEGGSVALMAVETWLITNGITNIAKATAVRYRPFVYNDAIPITEKLSKGSRRSFFSGHVSSSAAMSFFTAKVITDIYPNMENKWIVWVCGATIPAAVGYFRYEAGKHYPSDIITGYLVGAGLGYLIPKIQLNSDLNVIPISGAGFSFTYKLN